MKLNTVIPILLSHIRGNAGFEKTEVETILVKDSNISKINVLSNVTCNIMDIIITV